MTASIQKDKSGPDWPLGFIAVVTPGIPVSLMSVVDPTGVNDPSTNTPGTAGADEFTILANIIQIWADKPAANGHGTQTNTGNVYIVRKGVGAGTGNRDDSGSMVAILLPGQQFTIPVSALNRNVLSPYRYFVDGDNAGDGVFATLFIG